MHGQFGDMLAAFSALATFFIFIFFLVLGILVPFFVWRIHRNVSHTDAMLERLYPQIVKATAALELLAAQAQSSGAGQSGQDDTGTHESGEG